MQNECLLSIVSENWTHIFKSRKSEKPCMDYWAKKLGKIALKHVQNTFGQFWDRFWAFLEFWFFLFFFEKFREPDPPCNTGQFFFRKIATKHVQNKFGQFWERSWAFLQCWIFFDFFENFRWIHGTMSKKLFQKNRPKTRLDNRERFWTFLELWTFFDFFHELFLCLYLKKNPENWKLNSNFLSPENWTHIFMLRNLKS